MTVVQNRKSVTEVVYSYCWDCAFYEHYITVPTHVHVSETRSMKLICSACGTRIVFHLLHEESVTRCDGRELWVVRKRHRWNGVEDSQWWRSASQAAATAYAHQQREWLITVGFFL